jgi:hypothetical protein
VYVSTAASCPANAQMLQAHLHTWDSNVISLAVAKAGQLSHSLHTLLTLQAISHEQDLRHVVGHRTQGAAPNLQHLLATYPCQTLLQGHRGALHLSVNTAKATHHCFCQIAAGSMAAHLCIQHSPQRQANSFRLCDLTNTTTASAKELLESPPHQVPTNAVALCSSCPSNNNGYHSMSKTASVVLASCRTGTAHQLALEQICSPYLDQHPHHNGSRTRTSCCA